MTSRKSRPLLVLATLFAIEFVALGIAPHYRDDWMLENVLVVLLVGVLCATYRRIPFSLVSYTLIFIFLCVHEVGAHYTYVEVPYDEWFTSLWGTSLNSILGWERNNFDRIVHFLYGLLLAYPIRELFLRATAIRGFLSFFLPLDLTMSSSLAFEFFEWGAAAWFGGDLGMAYLGTQGDEWDAHKDMALASLGALTAMLVTMLWLWWSRPQASSKQME